ncbi:MAG: histidine phosphatase family protein [Candidatus Sumerlaeaceae bacterium]|nr:histidine phosphatase family protein [Candidatus Sumerlaeaceae bacterium]
MPESLARIPVAMRENIKSHQKKLIATKVIVVRHGQTRWNEEGRWQGRLNSPLTALGREQARKAGEIVRRYSLDAAYSSDAGRAVETAEIILEGTGITAIAHPALRERDYGVYEGLTAAEIEEHYPGTRFRDVGGSRETWAPPQGETMVQVRDRVRTFLLSLARQHTGQTLLLVTHSGIVRAVDSLCSGQTFDQIWHRVPQNGAVYVANVYPDGQFERVWDNLQQEPALVTNISTPISHQ